VIRLDPADALARCDLGSALRKLGRTTEAREAYEQALRLDPSLPEGHFNLALVLVDEGKAAEAIAHLEALLRLRPEDAEAHDTVASLLASAGRTAEAVAHYREAVRLRPDLLAAVDDLARILATSPDPRIRDSREAVALASRARAMSGNKEPLFLDTLAAALAAEGEFERASEVARTALDLARAQGRGELAAAIAEHLALYLKGEKAGQAGKAGEEGDTFP
jgi:tetratricopeptide (TPR) repeat protein